MRGLILLVIAPYVAFGGCTTYDIGFDFRATAGYVTDPSYGIPVLAETSTQNKTAANSCVGIYNWNSSAGGLDDRDRSTSVDSRLAGINFLSGSNSFIITLPSAGSYNIGAAFGDATAGQTGTGTVTFKDGATTLFTITISSSGGCFATAACWMDAGGNARTSSSLWAANNVMRSVTMTGTTLTVQWNYSSGSNFAFSHIRVTASGGPPPASGPTLTLLGVGQ